METMGNEQAVTKITSLLSMTSPTGQLPLVCQQAIAARDRGDWSEALALAEQGHYSTSWSADDDTCAQAVAVEGTIWQALGNLDQALRCYELARGNFCLGRNAWGEAVMHVALGMALEVQHAWSRAQSAYQAAEICFQGLCGRRRQPIERGDTESRRWCSVVSRILNTRLDAIRSRISARREHSPKWIYRLEAATAGEPQLYASQVWEQIEHMTTGHIQVEGVVYEPKPVGQKASGPLKFNPAMDYFITKAQGASMIDAGIHDGDLLLVQAQPQPENGQIVIVELESEEESVALVKRIRYDGPWIHLESANPAFQTRTFKQGAPRLRILGTVLAVLEKVPADAGAS